MSSDNDSVQDVLDSLDDLFEGAMAPHDEEPASPSSKAKSPPAAPADEADAILDELLSGGTATGSPMPDEQEQGPRSHPGARDGAVLDDSLNTLIYDSAEEGLNVGHLNTSPPPPPPEEELPSTESMMEDDLLSGLLGGSDFGAEPSPSAEKKSAPPSSDPAGDADAILNELLGGGEPPGNEKPLDEFLAEQSAEPAAAQPAGDDADAILDDLLGADTAASGDTPGESAPPDDDALSADEADAILDGLLGDGDDEPPPAEADADTLLGELSGELAGGPADASPLDTTDEILGDLLGDGAPAAESPPPSAEPEMAFEGDEDALLNDLLGGEEMSGAPAETPPAGDDGDDALLDDLMGSMAAEPAAASGADDDVEGLESLEDVFELGDGTITEKHTAPAEEGPATAPLTFDEEKEEEEETIPLLDDVVIPGDQLGQPGPMEPASSSALPPGLSDAQYDDLLNDLAGELQVRLAWRIEQQLKGAMDRLIHDALEQASTDLRESIRDQLKESLPSVLDRLSKG